MVLGRVGARASSEVAGGVRGLVYARVRLNPVLVESDRPTWGGEFPLVDVEKKIPAAPQSIAGTISRARR